MAKVEKTITINAPVEKVFSYVEEPINLPEYWPSMVEVRDVEQWPNSGAECLRPIGRKLALVLRSDAETVARNAGA